METAMPEVAHEPQAEVIKPTTEQEVLRKFAGEYDKRPDYATSVHLAPNSERTKGIVDEQLRETIDGSWAVLSKYFGARKDALPLKKAIVWEDPDYSRNAGTLARGRARVHDMAKHFEGFSDKYFTNPAGLARAPATPLGQKNTILLRLGEDGSLDPYFTIHELSHTFFRSINLEGAQKNSNKAFINEALAQIGETFLMTETYGEDWVRSCYDPGRLREGFNEIIPVAEGTASYDLEYLGPYNQETKLLQRYLFDHKGGFAKLSELVSHPEENLPDIFSAYEKTYGKPLAELYKEARDFYVPEQATPLPAYEQARIEMRGKLLEAYKANRYEGKNGVWELEGKIRNLKRLEVPEMISARDSRTPDGEPTRLSEYAGHRLYKRANIDTLTPEESEDEAKRQIANEIGCYSYNAGWFSARDATGNLILIPAMSGNEEKLEEAGYIKAPAAQGSLPVPLNNDPDRYLELMVASDLSSTEHESIQFPTTEPEILPALDAAQIGLIQKFPLTEVYKLDKFLDDRAKEGVNFLDLAKSFKDTPFFPIFEQVRTWMQTRGTTVEQVAIEDAIQSVRRRATQKSDLIDIAQDWHTDEPFPDPDGKEVWRVLWTDVNPIEFPNGTFLASQLKDPRIEYGDDMRAKANAIEKKKGLKDIPEGSIVMWRQESGVHRRPQFSSKIGLRNEVSFTFSIPRETPTLMEEVPSNIKVAIQDISPGFNYYRNYAEMGKVKSWREALSGRVGTAYHQLKEEGQDLGAQYATDMIWKRTGENLFARAQALKTEGNIDQLDDVLTQYFFSAHFRQMIYEHTSAGIRATGGLPRDEREREAVRNYLDLYSNKDRRPADQAVLELVAKGMSQDVFRVLKNNGHLIATFNAYRYDPMRPDWRSLDIFTRSISKSREVAGLASGHQYSDHIYRLDEELMPEEEWLARFDQLKASDASVIVDGITHESPFDEERTDRVLAHYTLQGLSKLGN